MKTRVVAVHGSGIQFDDTRPVSIIGETAGSSGAQSSSSLTSTGHGHIPDIEVTLLMLGDSDAKVSSVPSHRHSFSPAPAGPGVNITHSRAIDSCPRIRVAGTPPADPSSPQHTSPSHRSVFDNRTRHACEMS